MPRNPRTYADPDPQASVLIATPVGREHEASDPVDDIEILPLSRFTGSPKAIVALLEDTSREAVPILADIHADESLRHMGIPFREAYRQAVDDIREAFCDAPNITPGQIFERLWTRQRESSASWLDEDHEIGLCSFRIEQGYARMHGYQTALDRLASMVVPPGSHKVH